MKTAAMLFAVLILMPGVSVYGQVDIAAIDHDFQVRAITEREHLLYRGYALFAPERLPQVYRTPGRHSEKCGTWIVAELKENLHKLSAEEQAFFIEKLNRPSPVILPEAYDTPEGHFRIHYTVLAGDPQSPPSSWHQVPLDDGDQDGVPDFVEETGAAFEYAYDYYVNIAGYNPMPDDGDGLYDVYMMNIGSGMYGYTQPENDDPATNKYDPDSYIVISNDFQDPQLYTKGLDGLYVTAVHELHHAIQMGYVFRYSDRYFYEWTSTLMEDVVQPQVNDYFQYLDDLFNNLHKPITTSNGWHEYGMCLFLHMIYKNEGQDLIRKFWENLHLGPALNIMRDVMEDESALTLEQWVHRFQTWNYFTGARADTVNKYTDGRQFPEVRYTIDLSEPSDTTFSITSQKLSGQFIRIRRQQPTAFLVEAEGSADDPYVWNVGLHAYHSGEPGNLVSNQVAFLNGYSGSGNITTSGTSTELVIVASNTSMTASSQTNGLFDLSFSVSFEGPGIISDNRLLPTRPSPANFSKVSEIVIPFVLLEPTPVELKIYSISGRLLKSFPSEQYIEGIHTSLRWDGRDDDGNEVPSGVYISVMKGDGFTDVSKIAVVR